MKKQFLDEVRLEIENIKKFSTQKERKRLNFDSFNPTLSHNCIYGQLANSCDSKRAIELIKKCCKRYFNFENVSLGIKYNNGILFSNIKNCKTRINMPNDFVRNNYLQSRDYKYHSSLEVFIRLKNANNKNIISYIKGEKDKLVLEKK